MSLRMDFIIGCPNVLAASTACGVTERWFPPHFLVVAEFCIGVVPDEVVRALRDAASRYSVDDFWSIWSKNAEAGLFRTYSKAGGPTEAGSSAFLGRGLLRIRSRRPRGGLVGCIGLARVMR